MTKVEPYAAFEKVFRSNGIRYHTEESVSKEDIMFTSGCGYTIFIYNNTIIVNDVEVEEGTRVGTAKNTFFAAVVDDITYEQARLAYNSVIECHDNTTPSKVKEKITDLINVRYEIMSPF